MFSPLQSLIKRNARSHHRGVCEAHRKPMGMYGGVLLWMFALGGKWASSQSSGLAPSLYIPIGLWWNCSKDTRFTTLVKINFKYPHGGLNTCFALPSLGFWLCAELMSLLLLTLFSGDGVTSDDGRAFFSCEQPVSSCNYKFTFCLYL